MDSSPVAEGATINYFHAGKTRQYSPERSRAPLSRPMRSDQWVEWLVPPPITGDRSVETVRLSIGKDFFFNFIQYY